MLMPRRGGCIGGDSSFRLLPMATRSSLLSRIDDNTRLAGHNRLALLLFELGDGVLYGINVFKVREVLATPPLRPVPRAHPMVEGMIRVRDRDVLVLKLTTALGIGGEHPSGTAILSEFNRSVQGLLVARVDRIIHTSVEQVQPPPQLDGHRDGFLTAVTRHEGRLVEIIDVEHVLAQVVGKPRELSADWVATQRGRLAGCRPILVADDSRVARAQIVRTLDTLGLPSLVVNDGRAALRALQTAAQQGPLGESFSMLISDIEMPDMDGYRLATEVRGDARLAGLPVVLHTSLSGVFNAALVERVGADRFVPKFHAEDLAQAVVDMLCGGRGTALASGGSGPA